MSLNSNRRGGAIAILLTLCGLGALVGFAVRAEWVGFGIVLGASVLTVLAGHLTAGKNKKKNSKVTLYKSPQS
jgi:hypothetical protein